ncbi:AbrB/MazE/SpoVT family DNA-binding domain-containing protein [Flavobacterium weaverense]|uniref:Transcriptional regulator/antitoxin MazE n=1 Tax=Flavobacterium weaverense TaxID=271156 RepID=A0A3M0A178_9FLAO|nr:AbrB/MazE/SpoVT family DNA-binding domain-containing protein [Flavobacterium weaverense]RMA78357.1 transcriptional regulator/antitoxin MazE [Flavobacterium weaverense]
METEIIKIGNSKGLRLSKTILDKYNIKDKVEIILEEGQIIIKPIKTPRQNWETTFEKMSKEGDDKMLRNENFEEGNFEEGNQFNMQ